MRQTPTAELTPGMITSENIISTQGLLLLTKGTSLTPELIAMLEAHDIPAVRIADDTPDAAVLSHAQRVRQSAEFVRFQKEYNEHLERFETTLNDLVSHNTPLDTEWLLEDTISLLEQDGKPVHLLDMLMNVRDYDNSTYSHCVNVALICHIFSDWLHLSAEEQRIATLCGLLHDIGKLTIPHEILQKPSKLTPEEFDLVKLHALAGHDILSKQELGEHVLNAALMHHEKCDGSGYPSSLHGAHIDMYAKMVTIADIYDAMTSYRPYRKPFCPFDVIRHFEDEGLQKYDTRFILVFLENVVTSYLNQRVHLSNGMEGHIIFINRSDFANPTVRCGESFLDLSQSKDLYIEYIL